jgi:tetratricopeptide (TPR) repeat protein
MKNLIFLYALLSTFFAVGQENKSYLNGRHFGDHTTWSYIAEVTERKIGDTLVIEKRGFDKDKIHEVSGPTSLLNLKIVLDHNNIIVYVKDEVFFNGNLYYSLTHKKDSIIYVNNQRTVKLKTPTLPFFISMESLEVYLSKQNLSNDYDKEILMGLNEEQTGFRKFRLKVISTTQLADENKKIRQYYELAVFSKDNSNNGDGKLYISCDTKKVLKKEYIVHEKSIENNGLKSQAVEYVILPNYKIDLTKIKNPSSEDYVEAAFTEINKNKNPKAAISYIDKALKIGFTSELFLHKVTILNHLNKSDEALEFVLLNIDEPTLKVIDIHNVGRNFLNNGLTDKAIEVFTINISKNPNNSIPLIGMARALSVKGNYDDAKRYLSNALIFEKNTNQKKWIAKNIERLERNEKII